MRNRLHDQHNSVTLRVACASLARIREYRLGRRPEDHSLHRAGERVATDFV